MFRTAICNILYNITGNNELCNEVDTFVEKFQHAVKVVGVNNLAIQFYYNNQMVASVASRVHLECNPFIVLIESSMDGVLIDLAYGIFASQISLLLLKNISNKTWDKKKLTDVIPLLLKCNDWNQTKACLQQLGIKPITGEVLLKLGAEAPASLIDYDVSSELKEWVLYEKDDNTMIFVQVVDEILDVPRNSLGAAKYKVNLSKTESKYVSRLHLYNIKASVQVDQRSTDDIIDYLRHLLICFQSLEDNDREKLLERLYFTWLNQNESVLEFIKKHIVILFPE